MVGARAGLGLLLVVALSAAACGGEGGEGGNGEDASGGEGPLKIGVINPYSGPNAPGGEATFQGYEIAVEEANADGGVMGRQVELLRGDASTPEQGISEVNRLATSDEVDLFLGTYLSGISNTASETALRYGKLYWETNAVASDLTERGLENFVRTGPAADQFAQMANEAIENILSESLGTAVGDLVVCISHEESIYGTSISERVDESLREAGAEVTAVIPYPSTSPDLGNVVLSCQQDNPDVWINTGYVADVNLLLRTAQQQNFNPAAKLLIGSGDTDLTLDAVTAEVLEGDFVVSYPHFDIQDSYAPGTAEFLDSFVEKYGSEPTFAQSLNAYSGIKMLFDALNEAGSADPAAVRDTVSEWDKPVGTYPAGYGAKFDENFQNTLAQFTVLQWQGGEVITLYPEAAALEGVAVLESTG